MNIPDSKVHGAKMGPFWGRQDPGGLHLVIRDVICGVSLNTTQVKADSNEAQTTGMVSVVQTLAWRQSATTHYRSQWWATHMWSSEFTKGYDNFTILLIHLIITHSVPWCNCKEVKGNQHRYFQNTPMKQTSGGISKIETKYNNFRSSKCIWICRLQNSVYIVSASTRNRATAFVA